jgi:hypothetical protein
MKEWTRGDREADNGERRERGIDQQRVTWNRTDHQQVLTISNPPGHQTEDHYRGAAAAAAAFRWTRVWTLRLEAHNEGEATTNTAASH